jgi:hypothetical protein
MNIELNTKNKTIKILEECSFKELESFLKNIDDYKEYKLISDNKYLYQTVTSGTTSITTNPCNGFYSTTNSSN